MAMTETGVDDAVLREEAKPDPVTGPDHYEGDGFVDCKRAIESMHEGWSRYRGRTVADCMQMISVVYFATCAFKYIWRWPLKGGLQDLKKARECLDIAIKEWDREPF